MAYERLVISYARSLNRSNGLSLQSIGIFKLLLFFYYLINSVFFSFSYSFSYFFYFSVSVIVTVNCIIIFSVILPFQLQLQLTVITLLLYRISSKSDHIISLRYGDITIFKMTTSWIFQICFSSRGFCRHSVLHTHTKFR